MPVVLGLMACSPDKKSESLPVVAANFDEMNFLGIGTIKPERFEYEVKYGVVKGGIALFETSPTLVNADEQACWKTTIMGKTAGSVAWFSHVADTFYNYVNQAKQHTVRTERHIQEQRYTLHEVTYFRGDSAITYHSKRPQPIVKKLPEGNALGPVGSLQAMRFLPYETMQKYDTANVSFFMSRRTYQLRLVYLGAEKLKSKYGKTMAYMVSPVLPANSVMSESDRATIWISADENRVPLYCKAETRFGSVKVQLTQYKIY